MEGGAPATAELEEFCFDSSGYLIVRAALSAAEATALLEGATTEGLSSHPRLLPHLLWLTGREGVVVERAPELLPDGDGGSWHTGVLEGGEAPHDPTTAYYNRFGDRGGWRVCQGVVAVVALDAGSSRFVVVPGSHTSDVEAPASFDGQDLNTPKGLLAEMLLAPRLNRGDVLLVASATLHGLRPWQSGAQRLAVAEYRATAAPSRATPSPPPQLPDWAAGLGEMERAVLSGAGLRSDGSECSLVPLGDEQTHPSIFKRDDSANSISEEDLYRWETSGFLVLRSVSSVLFCTPSFPSARCAQQHYRPAGDG